MGNTKLCNVRSPDSFCTSFCIQKVSGDLHYLLAKRLVNTFWLSSLMNVNFVSPEVFFFHLHLLKALKLHLYRTKVQWVITKKVLNSKSNVANTRSTTCFSIYQLYLKIKDMKIWQQALTQQMKRLISPILKILTPRKLLHS